MATVEHLTPEAAIARIPDWEGLDVQVETLGGGITNHNYVVTVTGRPDLPWGGKYVMRIPGQGSDLFIDREVEHKNALAAADAGVSPPVLYSLEPEMCTVVPFIEARDDASRGPRRPSRPAGEGRRRGAAVPRQGHVRERDLRLRHDPRVPGDGARRRRAVPRRHRLDARARRRHRAGDEARPAGQRGLPLRPALRELHARAGRQDVGHRLGVRRPDRPLLRPRRLLRRAPLVRRRRTFHHHAVLRRLRRGRPTRG